MINDNIVSIYIYIYMFMHINDLNCMVWYGNKTSCAVLIRIVYRHVV